MNRFQEVSISRNKKIMTVFKVFYQILHVVCSLDFGFMRHKSMEIKVTVNALTITKYLVFSIATINHIYHHESLGRLIWFFGLLLQYLMSIIMLSCFKSDLTLCSFLSELHQIDTKLNVDSSSYYLELKALLTILGCVVCRLILTFTYCTKSQMCVRAAWATGVFAWLIMSMEILMISYAFIFYSVYCRLKVFSSILAKTSPTSDFGSFQYLYKSIVDVAEKYKNAFDAVRFEKYKNAFDAVYLVILLFNVPRLITSLYFAVKEALDVAHPVSPVGSINRFATHIESYAIIFSPALAASMLTTVAEKIKVILHEKCLQQQDGAQLKVINRFIRYVEARGCRFRVYKVIPLNADLLKMVLSFCATYLIVLIQLTHAY